MDLYAYIFNKYNKEIGIYKLNDEAYKYKNYDDNYCSADFVKFGVNYSSMIILSLEAIKGINVIQNRNLCKRAKNFVALYIQTDIIDSTIDNNEFALCFSKLNDLKIEKKIKKSYKKVLHKIKHQVNFIKLSLRMPSSFDIFLYILTLVTLVVSIISGDKNPIKNSYTLILTIVSLIRIISNFIHNKKDFEAKYNGAKAFNISNKDKIIEEIKKNKTNEYKDFISADFKADGEEKSPDIFLINDDENKKLRDFADTMALVESKNRVKKTEDSKNMMGYVLSSKVKSGKMIFNSKLAGIDSELNFYPNKKIALKPVMYFDYVTNDESIYRALTVASNPKYLFKGYEYTLYPNKAFKNIEGSSLTNLIGVNIICVINVINTNEKYVIINRQTTFTDVNHSKFVPSGSGSLNFADFKHNKNLSFKELLKVGMYRELEEESYLTEDYLNKHNAKFELLGFARLFSKAGKPDFFGMVTIEITKNECEEILKNYNKRQNEELKSNEEHTFLESNYMVLKEYDKFINGENGKLTYNKNESPQLRYVKYLLSKL